MKIDKVKVVSSSPSVPRPSHCSLWPVSVGEQQAVRLEEEEERRSGTGGGVGCQTQKAAIPLSES